MLDFYESLTALVKVAGAMTVAFEELYEVHRPDNGLTASCLELATLQHIQGELKALKLGESTNPALEDDSILGNPDRMLFHVKEYAASGEDEQAAHNPYVLTKLNLKTIENFQFDTYQKLLQEGGHAHQTSGQDEQLRRKGTQHHAYRFFPKLKARAQKIFIPSMLFLTCNAVEALRLRHLLSLALLQT